MELRIDKRNWRKIKLKDIATEYSKRINNPSESKFERFVGSSNINQWDYKVSSWEPTNSVTSAMKQFESGDYLLVRRSLYASDFRERSPRADFNGVCSGDILTIRENHELIVDGFLITVLNSPSLWKYIVANASGSITRRVKWKDLSEYEFLLPPKQQQRAIAQLAWSSNRAVESLVNLKNSLALTIQALFKERCANAKNSTEYKVSDLIIDGPRNGFSPKGNTAGEGSKTVSIGAVNKGRFNPDGKIKYAVVEDAILRKFDVKAEDVFIVRGNGNKSLCGKAGISENSYPDLFYPDLLIRLRFDKSIILPEFAVFQWNTLKAHMKLLQSAKSTNGIWKVNGDDIKRHKLIVPPLDEQRRIIDEISSVANRLAICEASSSSSDNLKKAIVNGLF